MVRWLPYEFDGVRSTAEVVQDLVVIAGNPWGRDEAHLTITPDYAEAFGSTGPLSLAERDPRSLVLLIGGVEVTSLALSEVRGAWLSTVDQADYYQLKIDLGSKVIALSDAYNGL